jgi:GNAT superfamily N-acetyltransferase
MTRVVVTEVGPGDEGLLAEVVELGNRNRGMLGLMPKGAFPEFAARGSLLAAHVDGQFVGYALYEVARQRVRLTHLCVDEKSRAGGVARALVDEISRKHHDLAGILATCRSDYPADGLWPVLGFQARHERRGRGKDGATLIHWWRDHGLPDLFTTTVSDEDVVVAIDHNIFIDLAIERQRPGAEESQALEADWLAGRIQLAVTSETPNEIRKNPDERERQRHRARLERFGKLNYTPADHDRVKAAWDQAVTAPRLKDAEDCRHIISAAAGGARIFVTRDEDLISRYAVHAADALGLQILRPPDLIVHLDEVADASKYRPVDLQGTELSVGVYGSDADKALVGFIDHAGGERKNAYARTLRSIAVDPTARRQWVRDASGRALAAWATRRVSDGRSLEVPLFRIDRKVPVSATLARLLALEIKQQTLRASRSLVRITDPHLAPNVRAGLLTDGFRPVGEAGELQCAVLDVRSKEEALRIADADHPMHEHVRAGVGAARTVEQVASLERSLWPAKLLDTDLETWIVPIRPTWSTDLLGTEQTLLHRPDLLGLSRELVYYHAPHNNPTVPSRILWYSSGSGRQRVGAAVAVSQLTAVDTDTPERLYRRYQHLGVYALSDVRAVAHNGRASALKFVDTEILGRYIPYERLKQLAGGHRLTTLQSPVRISSSLFGQIYQEGTGRDV